jgi:C-terminal processing protease CtpA/Prc
VPGRRILALVDNGCGSDCEAIVVLLAALPETIVVGVNTAGVGQFIQPGLALLPHTGLAFRMALGTSDTYGDGRSFDGYGLDVDVVLPHPEDWSDDDLVQLATELTDP